MDDDFDDQYRYVGIFEIFNDVIREIYRIRFLRNLTSRIALLALHIYIGCLTISVQCFNSLF